MNEDHRIPPVQFFHQRSPRSITEVDVIDGTMKDDAVRLEDIKSVRSFSERPIHVRQKQRGEEAETSWMLSYDLRCVFVYFPGFATGLEVISEVDTGRRNREDRDVNAVVLHN